MCFIRFAFETEQFNGIAELLEILGRYLTFDISLLVKKLRAKKLGRSYYHIHLVHLVTLESYEKLNQYQTICGPDLQGQETDLFLQGFNHFNLRQTSNPSFMWKKWVYSK